MKRTVAIACSTLLILLSVGRCRGAAFNGVPPQPKKKRLAYVPCIALKQLPPPGTAMSSTVVVTSSSSSTTAVTSTAPPTAAATAATAAAASIDVCLVVDARGFVYALENRCPPMNQPLVRGTVLEGGGENGSGESGGGAVAKIEDPLWGTQFSLQTGRVVGEWCPRAPKLVRELFLSGASAKKSIPTFGIRQHNGMIELEIDLELHG